MSSSERTKQLEAPMNARQASQRGGELLTHWDTKAGKITLSGKSVVWGEGNLVLPGIVRFGTICSAAA